MSDAGAALFREADIEGVPVPSVARSRPAAPPSRYSARASLIGATRAIQAALMRCMPSYRRLLVAGVIGGISIGCRSSVDPGISKSTSTFRLLTINGASLPIADTQSAGATITSGKVILIGRDSAQMQETTVKPSRAGEPPLTVTELAYYSVTRAGATLVLIPHALAVVADTAVSSHDTLVIKHQVPSTGDFEVRTYVAQ